MERSFDSGVTKDPETGKVPEPIFALRSRFQASDCTGRWHNSRARHRHDQSGKPQARPHERCRPIRRANCKRHWHTTVCAQNLVRTFKTTKTRRCLTLKREPKRVRIYPVRHGLKILNFSMTALNTLLVVIYFFETLPMNPEPQGTTTARAAAMNISRIRVPRQASLSRKTNDKDSLPQIDTQKVQQQVAEECGLETTFLERSRTFLDSPWARYSHELLPLVQDLACAAIVRQADLLYTDALLSLVKQIAMHPADIQNLNVDELLQMIKANTPSSTPLKSGNLFVFANRLAAELFWLDGKAQPPRGDDTLDAVFRNNPGLEQTFTELLNEAKREQEDINKDEFSGPSAGLHPDNFLARISRLKERSL